MLLFLGSFGIRGMFKKACQKLKIKFPLFLLLEDLKK